jgi:hypothetical protein
MSDISQDQVTNNVSDNEATAIIFSEENEKTQTEPTTPVEQPTITTAPVNTAAPVVNQNVVNPADTTTNNISAAGKIALQNIEDYMEAMKPRKPVTVEAGARHQVALYRAMTSIINNLNEDFKIVYSMMLNMMHKERDGVFHETHIFRFMDNVNLPEKDRKAFQRLINLCKVTADPKGRELALKQVNMEATLEHGITEAGRQKILHFYGK